MASDKTQSFASSVKDEVALKERSEREMRAFLTSFIKINGHLVYKDGKEILEAKSEKASIAKVVYQYIHACYKANVRFAYTRSAGFLKRINYLIIVESGVKEILDDLHISLLGDELPSINVSDEEFPSFLSGAFLAAGSVNDPKSTSYHLEIALYEENYAKWLTKTINHYGGASFHANYIKRRNEWVCYLKRADEISNFLILLGAKESCLYFENVRIDRDFSNQTNRLGNLDAANMGKTLKTAERQIKEIEFLNDKGLIDKIGNPKLSALSSLRLSNPDASLQELSVLLSEELASEVSKSNVNHLLRYIHSLYLEETKNER